MEQLPLDIKRYVWSFLDEKDVSKVTTLDDNHLYWKDRAQRQVNRKLDYKTICNIVEKIRDGEDCALYLGFYQIRMNSVDWDESIVEEVIQCKDFIDKYNSKTIVDRNDYSLIEWAIHIEDCSLSLFEKIANSGINLNTYNRYGETPLTECTNISVHENKKKFEILIRAGADISLVDWGQYIHIGPNNSITRKDIEYFENLSSSVLASKNK
jgi:hypothetical protein